MICICFIAVNSHINISEDDHVKQMHQDHVKQMHQDRDQKFEVEYRVSTPFCLAFDAVVLL